jgi:hypothetical protein
MTESRPWGAANETPKGEEAQHTPARTNIVALLRARRPRAPRHRRLRPNSGRALTRSPALEEGGTIRRQGQTADPRWRCVCEGELK